MARYQQGGKGAQPKKSATKTYGRSQRLKRYPLMPDGLSGIQAQWWFDHRYAKGRW